MELITQRLVLREFRHDDFDAVRDYESHPKTHRFEKAIPNDDAIRMHLNEIVAWSQENPRSQYCFAITVQPENIVRGQVSVSLNISDIREWEIGWKVHYDYWGKGYATEAARRVLAFAFHDLQAHRVVAFCNVDNAASVRVMDKLGMLQDGRLRETRWWNGAWQDEFVYAILDRDWECQAEQKNRRLCHTR